MLHQARDTTHRRAVQLGDMYYFLASIIHEATQRARPPTAVDSAEPIGYSRDYLINRRQVFLRRVRLYHEWYMSETTRRQDETA